MKIVWRNPNRIATKKTSIVRTGRVDAANLVQLFYRSSSGLGILGTHYELLVNRSGRLHRPRGFIRRPLQLGDGELLLLV